MCFTEKKICLLRTGDGWVGRKKLGSVTAVTRTFFVKERVEEMKS